VTDMETDKLTEEEFLKAAAARHGSNVALACSFGAEDMVILDIIAQAGIGIRAFILDTGRLNEETYALWDKSRARYGIEFQAFSPAPADVEALERANGPNPFYNSLEMRHACCGARKVKPLNRALSGLEAWVCGLRKGQSVTRADIGRVEIDKAHGGIYKLNPIVDWTERQVWDYIRKFDVPYNELHDKNYPSIGCAPCTRAVKPGEDVRAGRWWWEDPEGKECGLHSGK